MKTKQIISRIIAITLLAVMLFTLVGCETKLNGTYASRGLIAQTITFTNDGNITMSAFGLNISGKYKIDGDTLTVTYSVLGIDTNWEQSFRKQGNSIFIDGEEFVKQ